MDQKTGAAHEQSKFLIECKKTDKKSLSVKAEWLAKITREAQADGKEPCLVITIDGQLDPVAERDWAMIPVSVLKRLQDGYTGDE